MPKVLFFLIAGIIYFNSSLAQVQILFGKEIKFSRYLIDNYQYDDATLVLKNLSKAGNLNSNQFDSINYFRGWINYNQKKLDTSSFYLSRVSVNSPYFYKSKFYQAFNTAYTGYFRNAAAILESVKMDSVSEYQKLKNFELASFSLLQHHYKDFEKYEARFDGSYFPIAIEEKSLSAYYLKIKKHKPKSPLLAGTLSAIIPGSGKYYTGYRGQGVTAFLTVMSLAAISAESYYRAGPKTVQFISFTSIFAIFYAGNIWGSVSSVKKRNDIFYKELERNVLLDMHVPLRRVFN